MLVGCWILPQNYETNKANYSTYNNNNAIGIYIIQSIQSTKVN